MGERDNAGSSHKLIDICPNCWWACAWTVNPMATCPKCGHTFQRKAIADLVVPSDPTPKGESVVVETAPETPKGEDTNEPSDDGEPSDDEIKALLHYTKFWKEFSGNPRLWGEIRELTIEHMRKKYLKSARRQRNYKTLQDFFVGTMQNL